MGLVSELMLGGILVLLMIAVGKLDEIKKILMNR